MTSIYDILMMILDLVYYVILVQVIMSWLINFQVLNLRQPLVAQIWDALNRLLEPLYSQVRRIVPTTSGMDFAPLVVLLIIIGLRIVLRNNQAVFY